jgi:CelD/BcsL family acetyltransferase involved in cellulose biosynthesis
MTAVRHSMVTTIASNIASEDRLAEVSASAHRGGIEIVEQLADEWRDLGLRTTDDQPFYRPEWMTAHLRTFSPEARVLLIAVRVKQRLTLLLPLVEDRHFFAGIPVRKLQSPVNAHGGRFDAIKASGAEGELAIRKAWDFLQGLGGWDVLELRLVPEGGTVDEIMARASICGFRTVRIPERPNPIVTVPSDPDLLRNIPRNSRLRTQLRQARRELSQLGQLRFRSFHTADAQALERFYQLEASGWKGQEGSAIACSEVTRQFYNEVAAGAAHFGYFSLFMLELDNQLIAAHFSFTHRNRCYSPKVAYDENYKRFVPGHLIVAEILKDCLAREIREFDITGPDDDWKMKWTNETHAVSHHYAFNKGISARLAYRLGFWLKAWARRIIPKRRSS